jgi:hypothetical protein
MVFQRLSSESRHDQVVAADGNPPPFSHAICARVSVEPLPNQHAFWRHSVPVFCAVCAILSQFSVSACLSTTYDLFQVFSIKANQG